MDVQRLGLLPEEIERKLVESRVGLLFRSNPAGILVGINEPVEPQNDTAPLLYLCIGRRTVVFGRRADAPEHWLVDLSRVLEKFDGTNGFFAHEIERTVRASAKSAGIGAKVEIGPAYYVPWTSAPVAGVVEINLRNKDLLEPGFGYTAKHLEFLSPCTTILINGKAVAICRTVRRSSTAVEGGVDTLQAYRRKGYGAAVVASWAQKVWSEGLVPCYSTQWRNKASIALARSLGMVQYAMDVNIS